MLKVMREKRDSCLSVAGGRLINLTNNWTNDRIKVTLKRIKPLGKFCLERPMKQKSGVLVPFFHHGAGQEGREST